MVDYAFSFDRRFVASLIANAFFSTFPKGHQSTILKLVVPRLSFKTLFGNLHESLDQAFRLRNLLNYFDILQAEGKFYSYNL